MPYLQLDRHELSVRPLKERANKVHIVRDAVRTDATPTAFAAHAENVITETLERIRQAKDNGKPVMLTFGAHSIKNGLGPVIIELMEKGWVTHLATNGAGIIHDWEFAFQGASSEDVRANVQNGQFGIWHETGFNINLAIIVGAYLGYGYGEAVGALIENEGLDIPDVRTLKQQVLEALQFDGAEIAAAGCDFINVIEQFALKPGFFQIPHAYKSYSVQAAAYRLGIPFTSHPMFGHDIIYNHPMNHGAAIGRCAQRDFLSFAHSVNQLEGGVYLSIGSAVMSPMIFEKSLSMAQNLHMQKGSHIDNHYMLIVDLAQSDWDWQQCGEPPMDNPAYYLRYCKTFSRMGGQMRYLCADNRDLLLRLHQELCRG